MFIGNCSTLITTSFKPKTFSLKPESETKHFFYVGYICEVENPNYRVIDGSCYYFETTELLNYEQAQINCRTKFGNLVGGLFEPRTSDTNELVFNEATNFVTSTIDDFWLGINDLAIQG